MRLPNAYSFRYVSLKSLKNRRRDWVGGVVGSFEQKFEGKSFEKESEVEQEKEPVDSDRRNFLKLAGLAGVGVAVMSAIPKKAEAYVMGGTPSTSVVGVKDSSNTRIDPAIKTGNLILKKTVALTSSGTVHTPSSGKKIRIYNSKFSLSADMTSVAFRFTSGGTDYEYYYAPKSGGLYGSNNHPNYIEGGVDQAFYASISGTGTVQINLDYLEV